MTISTYDPDAAEEGMIAGAIFAAADAALKIDQYGKATWYYHASGDRDAHHRLLFKVSCDDVLENGPIHVARQLACKKAMYDQLYKLLQRYG